ncbi:serine hydrolase [Anaeromyxobacter oryzae]|uniref:beta-lactamase n=1 Tax=Anaeromyxobacter oryzae TaxID=2918170 RepID=A0ABM7WW69_9BACT|nr:serine hydrolase [Anaeromyxobacter oryzae]BDG03744.1 hypothetical protein AMOR_27400 [Anaeromyxobacter oryzae]
MHAAPLLLVLALAAAPSRARPAPPPRDLAHALLDAVHAAGLDELADAGADEGSCPTGPGCPRPLPRIGAVPNLDVAVIRLDAEGRALEAADVQLAPDAPGGVIVPLDRDLAARVRFRRWSPARREAADAGPPFRDEDDVGGRRNGRDFMAPYPASVFKLVVAFHVLRRAADSALSLGLPVADGPGPDAEVRPVEEWLDAMITRSDNRATRALLRYLHARGEVDRMNADLAALGLGTLRVEGTSPEDGGRWAPGEVNVTAMDAARLLWLVAGGPGVLWYAPGGRPVTRKALPEKARARLLTLLGDQGMHDVLSSGSLCGVRPEGIPARVPGRFVDPATGAETVGEIAYGRDVRPCNAAAEVRFLHKTGLTWNFAADAGIVESLPGEPARRYVIVLVASAGSRYLDPENAAAPLHPCDAERLCVSGRIARIGAAVDEYATRAARRSRAR